MLKSTVAIVLSIALAVTGLNTDIISQAASITQKVTQEESKITAKQKEDAKREDEKVKEKLKDTKESKEKNKKATVVKELKELRNSNPTTYLLSDGSKKLEICGEDIRYKENGKYIDYDPSLKKISKSEKSELSENKHAVYGDGAEYVYVNTAGDTKQYFPETLDENSAVVLTKKNYKISFAPILETDNEHKGTESGEIIASDNEKITGLGNQKNKVNKDSLLEIKEKSVKKR